MTPTLTMGRWDDGRMTIDDWTMDDRCLGIANGDRYGRLSEPSVVSSMIDDWP